MNRVNVKICGITRREDASAAVRLGADALGFIFAPSPRQILAETARSIIQKIPPFVKTVGVFVNEETATIRRLINYCGLDLVQLHGDESPEFCQNLMPYTIKAFRIKNESSLQRCKAYETSARALLLDTYTKNKIGGTGKSFDWRLALKIKEMGLPVILSGGLGPSNIDAALRTARPYAVDVNSGVENRPGKKSYGLMKELMETIGRFTAKINIE